MQLIFKQQSFCINIVLLLYSFIVLWWATFWDCGSKFAVFIISYSNAQEAWHLHRQLWRKRKERNCFVFLSANSRWPKQCKLFGRFETNQSKNYFQLYIKSFLLQLCNLIGLLSCSFAELKLLTISSSWKVSFSQ